MRYAKYKPTGIAWLPEVPEGWEERRARYLFKKEQRPIRDSDEIVTAFRDGQVTLRKNRRTTGFTEATDYSHYQGIRKGDLVIHQMDAFAGCAGVSDSDGMGTPVLSACTPKVEEVDVFYFAHIVRLMGRNGFIQSLARGIRERSADFRFETFARQILPLPPLAEQKAIAAYLDDKCSKVDALVAAKTKEVKLLKELRERVIADAVTGRLGNGEWGTGNGGERRFKPSGIAWLPEVPEGREVVRNKAFMTLTDERVGERKDKFPLLSLTKQGVIIRDVSSGKGKFPKEYDSYLVVRPNNLVFCLFDIEETPRTVGLVQNVGMLTGAYSNFELDQKMVYPEFAYYYYLFVDNGKRLAPYYTGLRKVVKTSTFMSLRFPLPPLAEQKAIVEYIEKKTAKIDELAAKFEDEVVKLKEYRERLVADVVTGQRKVV